MLASDGLAVHHEWWLPDHLPVLYLSGVTTGGYRMSDTIPSAPGIYCILNEITGKLYIGSSVNLYNRKRKHFQMLARGCHLNKHLQSSVAKYGLSAFSFNIIELIDDKEMLIEREQFYMDEAASYKRANGYNSSPTASSNLGFQHSDETKARISEARKGKKHPLWGTHLSNETKAKISKAFKGKKLSDETRAKMSKATKGEKHPMWGKQRSNETKAKISKAHRGKKLSDEHRQKMSVARLGKKHSVETRTKISVAKLGKKHSDETRAKISRTSLGRKHSCETRARMSEAQLNRWRQYNVERDKLQLQLDF